MSSSTSELEKKTSFNIFDFWKTKGDGEESISKHMQEDILNQSEGDEHENENAWEAIPQEETNTAWSSFVGVFKQAADEPKEKADEKEGALQALIDKARGFHSTPDSDTAESTRREEIEAVFEEIKLVVQQVSDAFGEDIDVKQLSLVGFNYFLEDEESRKTPSWKRRKHRFMQHLKLETIYSLHDALYLAEASYMDSVDDIVFALKEYKGPPYELVFCSTEAKPRQPAHFIAIKKTPPMKVKSNFPWKNDDNNVLEILMVVRGTKEVADMISDCLLGTREYCGGCAHDGIYQSGLYLVEKHEAFLKKLLTESGRSSIRLSLIGHSLGAGSAAIACMEFDNRCSEWIDASCIGFGCPALVSKELSEQYKSKITTVVSDADCVPRMSAATVKNLILDVMSFDWSEHGLRDIRELMDVLKMKVPFELSEQPRNKALALAQSYVDDELKPRIAKANKKRETPELFPPGTCIHMYRDGHGISATYVPCDFFCEIDLCRTLIDDHLVPPGYNRIFISWARQHLDSRFFFRNDVNQLIAETHRRAKQDDTNKE